MDHPHDPLKHMWRVLVRIENVSPDTLTFSLPMESRDRSYQIAVRRLPSAIRDCLMSRWISTKPFLHVMTNVGQSRMDRRKYAGWSM